MHYRNNINVEDENEDERDENINNSKEEFLQNESSN